LSPDFPPIAAPASVASKLPDTNAGTLEEAKKGCGTSQQISTITSVKPKYRFLRFPLLDMFCLDYPESLPQKISALITF
jgi:hypothetical protein